MFHARRIHPAAKAAHETRGICVLVPQRSALHTQDLCLVAEADGDPVRLRVGPLQLVDLRARSICQDGVCKQQASVNEGLDLKVERVQSAAGPLQLADPEAGIVRQDGVCRQHKSTGKHWLFVVVLCVSGLSQHPCQSPNAVCRQQVCIGGQLRYRCKVGRCALETSPTGERMSGCKHVLHGRRPAAAILQLSHRPLLLELAPSFQQTRDVVACTTQQLPCILVPHKRLRCSKKLERQSEPRNAVHNNSTC